MHYCTDGSFETGYFLAEKGLVTLSLGQSMALSQLQSHDTVPLLLLQKYSSKLWLITGSTN
jgi:uncharacterized sodium:solute symporter family permease YidK